jgi:hypothetical protein
MTVPTPPPASGGSEIKPVQIFGGIIALSGFLLGVSSLLPFYRVDLFGLASADIGAFEDVGKTDTWLAGIPAGVLIALGGLALVAAGAVLIWNGNQSYSKIAAIVSAVAPFGVWMAVAGNFGYALQQIDNSLEDSSTSFSGGSFTTRSSASASDFLHPAAGWWLSGLVVWLTLIGAVGALIMVLGKSSMFTKAKPVAASPGWTPTTPPAQAASSGPVALASPPAPAAPQPTAPQPAAGETAWFPPPVAPPGQTPAPPPPRITDQPGEF